MYYSLRTFIVMLVVSGIIILGTAAVAYDIPRVANIQLSRQNVFYIGVDNPVVIAIPGVAYTDMVISMSNGNIFPDSLHAGHYIIRVVTGGDSRITVKYRTQDGDTVSAGTFDYRNKKIPDPVAYVNNIRHDGIVLQKDLQNLTGVFTRMENFDFDCSFIPQSYSMSVIESGAWKEYKATGPALTAEMRTALQSALPEDKIIFHNVATKGPDGTIRKVNDVVITVK